MAKGATAAAPPAEQPAQPAVEPDAARRAREAGVDEPDDVSAFLEYVAETPIDVLPYVMGARLDAGTVPARVIAAFEALGNGDATAIGDLLDEYESRDLEPKIQAVVASVAGVAGGGPVTPPPPADQPTPTHDEKEG